MKIGNVALDALAGLPYFKGKGTLALMILRAFPNELLTAPLPYGGRIYVGLDAMRQSVLPYWIGKYESEVVRVFREHLARLKPNEQVIDIGSSIGFYTVIAASAQRAMGIGTVHSFEPNPLAYAELERNILLNHFTGVIAHCRGIGDEISDATLFVNAGAITYGSLRRTQEFLGDKIRVPVITLDAYTRSIAPGKIGLVKLDVEGAELLVLHGARQVLLRDQPVLLYEEFERGYQQFGYSTRDVRTFLTNLGYTQYAIPETYSSKPLQKISAAEIDAHGYQNVLAVPPR